MSEKLTAGFSEFIRLRQRIFAILRLKVGDATFGKGYEGILQLTFPSMLEENVNDPTFILALESQILFLGRSNAWSGSSLAEVVRKANKDIDLYEKDSTDGSDSADS